MNTVVTHGLRLLAVTEAEKGQDHFVITGIIGIIVILVVVAMIFGDKDDTL